MVRRLFLAILHHDQPLLILPMHADAGAFLLVLGLWSGAHEWSVVRVQVESVRAGALVRREYAIADLVGDVDTGTLPKPNHILSTHHGVGIWRHCVPSRRMINMVLLLLHLKLEVSHYFD